MFRGITATTIDAKGRITVPTKHRNDISAACSGQIVITVDIDRCLIIYPLPEWERVESDLLSLPNMGKQVRRLHRLYLGYAKACEVDGQFRVLLPQELREFAGLEKNVYLVGQGNKFELWDEGSWQQGCEDWLKAESDSEKGESILDQIII